MQKLYTYFTKPYLIVLALNHTFLQKYLPDELVVRSLWRNFYGREIDLNEPVTLCEKLQWLKLNYRKKEFTLMVDKYEAKKYVDEKIGSGHTIPTIGVWDNFDEIDFDLLPDKFVLKPTHDSGGLVICRDKSTFNKEAARNKLIGSLTNNYPELFTAVLFRNVLV